MPGRKQSSGESFRPEGMIYCKTKFSGKGSVYDLESSLLPYVSKRYRLDCDFSPGPGECSEENNLLRKTRWPLKDEHKPVDTFDDKGVFEI
jgi:hypothetical protein